LAELQAPTGELKEAPLRRDVRSLGALLGEVLREQAGLPLYEAVEDLRRTAIARREADANSTDAHAALAEQHLHHALGRVQSLTNATAYQLARAFAFFFSSSPTWPRPTTASAADSPASRILYVPPTTITSAASKPACLA
jgi:phosphoenolpyruvate carboxylase